MARAFSFSDVKNVVKWQQNIIEKMDSVNFSSENYRMKTKEVSEALVTKEVLNVLADISIKEINRDKRGIRVNTLRDYGYRSIVDI